MFQRFTNPRTILPMNGFQRLLRRSSDALDKLDMLDKLDKLDTLDMSRLYFSPIQFNMFQRFTNPQTILLMDGIQPLFWQSSDKQA